MKNAELAAQLWNEANALTELQQKERGVRAGVTVEGKPCKLMDAYVSTPEREARAAKIIHLRQRSAALENA